MIKKLVLKKWKGQNFMLFIGIQMKFYLNQKKLWIFLVIIIISLFGMKTMKENLIMELKLFPIQILWEKGQLLIIKYKKLFKFEDYILLFL